MRSRCQSEGFSLSSQAHVVRFSVIIALVGVAGCTHEQRDNGMRISETSTSVEAMLLNGTVVYSTTIGVGESKPVARASRGQGGTLTMAELYKDRPLRVHFNKINGNGQGEMLSFDLHVENGSLVAEPVHDLDLKAAGTPERSTSRLVVALADSQAEFDQYVANALAGTIPSRTDGYKGLELPKKFIEQSAKIAVVSNGVLFIQEDGMPDWSQGLVWTPDGVDAMKLKPPTETEIVKVKQLAGHWWWYLAQ